jgi:hypothetical protein
MHLLLGHFATAEDVGNLRSAQVTSASIAVDYQLSATLVAIPEPCSEGACSIAVRVSIHMLGATDES